jgi:imidazolonepropionase-like amidohydrolase
LPRVGRVAEGALADLVVYREDPLEAIETVLEPLLVFRDGDVVAGSEASRRREGQAARSRDVGKT